MYAGSCRNGRGSVRECAHDLVFVYGSPIVCSVPYECELVCDAVVPCLLYGGIVSETPDCLCVSARERVSLSLHGECIRVCSEVLCFP